MIGCGYPSFYVYYKHGYLNLDLQTGGVFLYNFHYIQGVPGGMDKTSGECSLG